MTELELIGRRIASVRVLRGLNQSELAEAIDVSLRTIRNVEAGRNAIGVLAVAKAARFLQVSADYLLGLTDEMAPKQTDPAEADGVAA